MTKDKVVKAVGEVLSSPPKVGIVNEVEDQPKSFSELQKKLKMTSGNLNYHLLRLTSAGLLTKDTENRYAITPLGRDVDEVVKKALKASEEIEF
jgi:DNA-binding HxlR family transcriptional regulator